MPPRDGRRASLRAGCGWMRWFRWSRALVGQFDVACVVAFALGAGFVAPCSVAAEGRPVTSGPVTVLSAPGVEFGPLYLVHLTDATFSVVSHVGGVGGQSPPGGLKAAIAVERGSQEYGVPPPGIEAEVFLTPHKGAYRLSVIGRGVPTALSMRLRVRLSWRGGAADRVFSVASLRHQLRPMAEGQFASSEAVVGVPVPRRIAGDGADAASATRWANVPAAQMEGSGTLRRHVVQNGETLSAIARNYLPRGVALADMAAALFVLNRGILYVSQTLETPPAGVELAVPDADQVRQIVQRGGNGGSS